MGIVENCLRDAVEQAANRIADCLETPSLAAAICAVFDPILRDYAEVLTAALVAGDTPEQFAERLMALAGHAEHVHSATTEES